MPVDEQVVELVYGVDSEERMTISPKRRGVSFNSPLELNSYMPVAPFPSRLVVAKGSVGKEEVSPTRTFSDASPTAKGKHVWVEVNKEENDQEEEREEVVCPGNLSIKQGDPGTF